MNLILSTKKIVAAALYYSGFIRCLHYRNNNLSIILAYHRILPKDSNDILFIQPGMYVTVETFEKHMAFISKNFKILSLEDLADHHRLKNACMVTFDDGWADNYDYAFPILKKYGIPATIFLSTNLVGKKEWPWTDRIAYYIHSIPVNEFVHTWKAILRKIQLEYFGSDLSAQDKRIIREHVINYMKNLDNLMILSVMEELDKAMSNQKDCLMKTGPWLTWDKVMEMMKAGISFGSHTHNHLILTRIPFQQAREEIALSQRILSEKMGKTVTTFCYPNGDFNDDTMQIVEESGYKIAVTTRRGSINESSNLLALNRTMLHNDMTSSIPMLACVLTNKIPFF
jgi:peptidoglycan/xylan/chitin deacetylase (PgdA/CDA1 family)